MQVILKPSPSKVHHYRIVLPSKVAIDIGHVSETYYVQHKCPFRMRKQLLERGATISPEIMDETDPYEIHRKMLYVGNSTQEDWDNYNTREYWERWLLFSYPTTHQSKLWMTMQQGILFMPRPDDFFYLP